jgi:O-antigen/teichoic acid export membrane protein
LLFSVFLVSIGLSIIGAILALIVASLVELAVARYFSRLPFLRRSSFPIKSFWSYAIPLFFTAVVFRLFDQLGLYFLKVLGGSVEEVGYYGAAQNLALLPALFSITLAPILLSALGYLQSEDDEQHSLELSRNTMRLVIILLPFVGIVAGAAQEIVVFIFGSAFAPSATLLKVLIFGGEALVMVQVATSILIAAGRPNLNLNLSLMMLVFVCVGYILLIPSFGGVGAAFATTIVSFIGALTAVLLVHRIWRVHPPVGTLLRSGFICVIGYILAERLSTPGLWVILKMVVLGLLSLLALIVLGEFSSKEFAFMRSLLARSANIETDLREVREEQELLEGDNL